MTMIRRLPIILIAVIASMPVHAQELSKANKPLKALLITGGCCHDYARQKLILTRGISARANVVWTVVHQGGSTTDTPLPVYMDPNWSEGFDVVVHNECFSDVKDKKFVDNILKPHREGLPALLIHCAMHCYRVGDDQWFKFVGMRSPGHGPHYSYTVDNVNPKHPIMEGFGDMFVAPKGELYHSTFLFDTATPLGRAKRNSDGEAQTCVWTNKYKNGNVFATTIGHYNITMAQPKYLDMVTRGLLWACGKDTKKDFTSTTKEIDEEIMKLAAISLEPANAGETVSKLPIRCCGEGNLVFEQATTASSEEKNKNNYAKHAVDGDLTTRWCAAGGGAGQWQVKLAETKHVRSMRIHWEKNDAAYRYFIDASEDGETWDTVVDLSKNTKKSKIDAHTVDAPNTNYIRVRFLNSSPSYWASFWEFEAYETKDMPELPKELRQQNRSESPGSTTSTRDVQAPDGFNVSLFGVPPEVNYPVCIAAAATGEVFVGVDPQGSLGKEPGFGKVLRCIDTDGDGQADKTNVFAEMDHPRGLFYDNGSLWVLHPPLLSVFHDDDRDGTADRSDILISGITTDELHNRGADHTTNGIRVGIDGWIYIAVGDFGFTEAKGADGRVIAKRGGGILRVRPDGTEMEIHNWGQRNILDVCIDPFMNIFTRDNTNDGGGWDIRLSHVLQSGEYGYPSLYLNFTEESLPPLADYGGGSGCGAMFVHDLRWPTPFANAVYTCDWGTSEVYIHNLPANGPTFDAHQEVFLKIPRPTDIDIDGSGRMYVTSWKNGKFAYSGPDVGFVAQITPIDFTPKPFPDLNDASDEQLIEFLAHPSAVYRLHSQWEFLRRKVTPDNLSRLLMLAQSPTTPDYGRVAAIYTLKQAIPAANQMLIQTMKDPAVREYAIRAVTDRRSQLEGLNAELFTPLLKDEDPRVRGQALIALGRLGDPAAGKYILPLTVRNDAYPKPTEEPLYKQPDPGRVIPHLAVRALQACNASEACLEAIGGPYSDGAFWALKYIHTPDAVNGLIRKLSRTQNDSIRQQIVNTLIRLYFQEGEYKGGWWGTRPDRTGPYFDRQKWSSTASIEKVIKTYVEDASKSAFDITVAELARHKVEIPGLPTADAIAEKRAMDMPIELPKSDPDNPNQIANLQLDKVLERADASSGDPAKGLELFKQQLCVSCHTTADGQNPKGPHMVDIGKRYKKNELLESVLKPSAKIAQGFDTYAFITVEGKQVSGFVTSESADSVQVRQADGVSVKIMTEDIEVRRKLEGSMMPKGLVNNLTPEQLADLIAYLQSL